VSCSHSLRLHALAFISSRRPKRLRFKVLCGCARALMDTRFRQYRSMEPALSTPICHSLVYMSEFVCILHGLLFCTCAAGTVWHKSGISEGGNNWHGVDAQFVMHNACLHHWPVDFWYNSFYLYSSCGHSSRLHAPIIISSRLPRQFLRGSVLSDCGCALAVRALSRLRAASTERFSMLVCCLLAYKCMNPYLFFVD
jgi:hypothetical protein